MRSYIVFLRTDWPLLLFGFLCVFWGNLGQSFFLGWYGEAIKTSLGISAKEYGLMYSMATLFGALGIMWLGGLIDRWPLSRFITFVALGLLCACVALYLSTAAWVLFVGLFLVRFFGQGMMPHSGLTSMARHFTVNRGKALSLASTGVSIGEVALPMLAVFLLGRMTWQHSWLWMALSIPLVFLPLALLLLKRSSWCDPHLQRSDAPEQEQPAKSSGRSILLKDRRFWMATPTLMATPTMLTAIFIHQDFVLNEKQWSLEWMATCFVVYGVVHWFSSLLFGFLVDRFSANVLLRVYSLPLLAAVLLVANMNGNWVAVAMMLLLGTSIGAAGPVVGALWAEVYGTELLGGVRSTSGSLILLSTAVSPTLFGWFIDHGVGLPTLFNAAAAFFICGWFALLFSYGARRPASGRD